MIQAVDKLKEFMMSGLLTWVSDELHSVTGISDKTIANFFIGLAEKSTSPDDLLEKIRKTETLDIDDKVSTFAKSLYDKVPRASSTSGSASKQRQSENRAKEQAAMAMQGK